MPLLAAAVREQVGEYLDYLTQYNILSPTLIRQFEDARVLRAFASTLRKDRVARLPGYEFRIASVRMLSGRPADCVIAIRQSVLIDRKLRAFVGHRFTPPVTTSLRANLQHVLRPYDIEAWYSDSDTPNGPIFNTIIERIRQSDFCIFDDRDTEIRPNVLIEMGAAIALGKPYFYFNYANKRSVIVSRRRERITTASDLAGMLATSYTRYDALLRNFAMRLPDFLVNRGLAKRV